MIRDPFYSQVIERLNGELHDETFERCSQVLLRTIYPTLVPIRGGSDGGMDGVTADLDGNQRVLVATTRKDVIGNLRGSLKRMLSEENPCRRIISATSQKLSPKRQKNLKAEAKKLGFRLDQVYERAGMANLLYGSPKWCKELLNLTGDPPPLSIIPKTSRPVITDTLIGREGDAKWLTEGTGDRLLVGQPGSGKTFLLSSLAKQNGWLFVVSRDAGQIAGGIRSQNPSALLVDDAHAEPDFLTALSHLRSEINATVPIIATCWPGGKEAVMGSLNLTEKCVRELGRLTRTEINDVLKAVGILGPDGLIWHLLNQAEGRPGLAVTLAHLCLEGDENDLEKVVSGNALVEFVRQGFEKSAGHRAINVLACFAVGGEAGVDMNAVAGFLEFPPADVRDIVVGLAAGGVISDVDGKHLSIRPPELRHALVRDVFFSGANSLEIERLLRNVPSISETALTLVEARSCGAVIRPSLLNDLLEHSRHQEAWESYAWQGPDESRHTLGQHPELVISLARPTLHHAPEIAIPLLLEIAIDDHRALHSYPDHPLRLIEDWIKSARPGSGEPLRRREALLSAAEVWLNTDWNAHVGIHALSMLLTPAFESHSTDPVRGDSVTFHRGLLSPEEIRDIAKLWDRVVVLLESIESPQWSHVLTAISGWASPHLHTVASLPRELSKEMRAIGMRMIQDVARIGSPRPGLMHRVNELAENLRLDLETYTNAEFEALFPARHRDHRKEVREQQAEAIKQLAKRWAADDPRTVVNRVKGHLDEARTIDEGHNYISWLFSLISTHTRDPLTWIEAIIASELLGDLVAPFIAKAAALRTRGWEHVTRRCLADDATRYSAVDAIIVMQDAPSDLLDDVMACRDDLKGIVEHRCAGNDVPEETVRCLLTHDDDVIAAHAAYGVWLVDPQETVPDSLRFNWESAILRGNQKDHWLGNVFKKEQELAFQWLCNEIKDEHRWWSQHEAATKEALKVISYEQRQHVLQHFPEGVSPRELLPMLIRDDVMLYREFLTMPRYDRYHLVPLLEQPNEPSWIEKARAALDAGFSPEEVADATVRWPTGSMWCGNISDIWKRLSEAFESLRRDDDERIREVAAHGIDLSNKRRDDELKREREEDTYARP